LALNLGGATLAWTSWPLLALFALAFGLGGAFVGRLLTAPEPLIPLAILASPEARLVITANAFGWGSIIGLNIFLPMFLQSVVGVSPTSAGLSLMILMATLNFSAGAAGQVIGRVERYKTVPLIGLTVAIASVALLAWRGGDLGLVGFEILVALIGIGFGPLAPLTTVVLQNSVAIHQFGTAMGTMNFGRNLFATVVVAVFGAIVLGGSPLAANGVGSREGFARGVLVAAACMSVSFLCMLMLKEKPLHTDVVAGAP